MKADDGEHTDEDLERIKCRQLHRDADEETRVVISHHAEDEYADLDQKFIDRLERTIQRWCEGHPPTKEMYNKEGRTPGKTMMFAFKTFSVRLYGFVARFSSNKTFFIVDIDPAKKQNKPDKNITKRAKDRVDALVKEIAND